MTYISSSFIIIFFYLIFFKFSKNLKIKFSTFNIFFLIKVFFIVLFISLHEFELYGTDTLSHYHNFNNFNLKNQLMGDNLILGMNYILVNFFYMNFLTINLLTIAPTMFGLMLLLSIIKDVKDYHCRLILYFLLFIPSFNFWTNGLNKDMFTFFGSSILFYGIYKKNLVVIFISILILFLVRPYIAFTLLLSSSLILVALSFANFRIRKLPIFILYVLGFYFVILFIEYIAATLLGSFGIQFLSGDFTSIITNLQQHYSDTPLGIDSDTSYFSRFFSFLFFPLPFYTVGWNIYFLVMMLENLFLLIALIFILYKNNFFKGFNYYYLFGMFYLIILFSMLAIVTSNHGIAIRQKWMIIPYVLILLGSSFKKLK